MCQITNIRTRKRIGYKIVAEKNGRFYSTFTGQELRPGIVPKYPKNAKTLVLRQWVEDVDDGIFTSNPNFNKHFNGKTACYLKLSIAKFKAELFSKILKDDSYRLVIAKVKYKGTVYKGTYDYYNIIAGSVISTIEIEEIIKLDI